MQEQAAPRRKKGWMKLKVSKVIDETWDTKTFYLEDADEGSCPFDYIAGQYLTIRFDDISEKPVARSYTMSSSPIQQGFAALTIKRVPGGLVSNHFCDHVKVGSVIKALGPIGKFVWDGKRCRDNLLVLGAGSGITPFISIAREYAKRLGEPLAPKKMTLLVAYRSQEDLICWQDLVDLGKTPGIRVITTLTREDARDKGFLFGRPDKQMFEEICKDSYSNTTYMTCGPEVMMENFCAFLRSKNVPDEHIMLESFGN